MGSLRRMGQQLPALVVLGVAWQLLADWLQAPLLPTPAEVGQVLVKEWHNGELTLHLGATLGRVAIAFILAMGIGCVLGIAMGLRPGINRLLDPLLVMMLNLPALVVIILLYIWLGLEEWAAILAVVINKVPNVMVVLRQGARSLDSQFHAMAMVYRVSRWRQLQHIVLPQLAPYFLVAARSGLALIWKIVLVVELLGRSEGVGFALHLAFQMFDVAMILGYSLAFILIVQMIEWLLLQPWEHYQQRWRVAQCA